MCIVYSSATPRDLYITDPEFNMCYSITIAKIIATYRKYSIKRSSVLGLDQACCYVISLPKAMLEHVAPRDASVLLIAPAI
jgi:hypothetical protein